MYEGNRLGTLVVTSIIFCVSVSTSRGSTAVGLSNSGMSPHYNLSNEAIICKSMDIRNSLDSILDLENCTVVEGFVQILLFDNVGESEFKNISFPKLTEITDFLLLYRVNGLRSVGQLFPNLAVIRGQNKLLESYSLIIYEMSNLQDIGLYSLREITSGFVRIDKNPSLCYVSTIQWDVIALEKGEHFMKNIRSEDECPLCPGEDMPSNISCRNPNQCWNRDHCQVICPDKCKNSCDSKGNCCGPNCIGCKDNQPNECLVCKHVVAAESICLKDCPRGFYKHLNRRCVTKEECINQPRPIQLSGKPKQDRPYRILDDKCVLECPPDYTEKHNECYKCDTGICRKECPGIVIDSLQSAAELHRCTHINGSLEIQIRGGKNVVNKLEEHLSMIQVIDGYLKIVRSFPLISLNFLKKLRHIRGSVLESNKYVFFILDNQNLQDIWDWTNRTLQIDRGKLFFHFNPRLCLDKIRTLQLKTNVEDYTDLEVASNSNGDKIACNITRLQVNISRVTSQSMVLTWEKFEMYDHRRLLGYVVYTIQSPPDRNLTVFDGRDACGADGWRVDDIPIAKDKPTYILTQLEPYTWYAIYVKTYTIASEQAGAQSEIKYFRTAAGKPSIPMDLSYKNQNHTTLLTWKPPRKRNGLINRYIVTGHIVPTSLDLLGMRDFCSTRKKASQKAAKAYQPQPTMKENETCECTDENENYYGPPKATLKNQEVAQDEIDFENSLYDLVYKKREETHPHFVNKRSVDNLQMMDRDNAINKSSPVAQYYYKETKNTTDSRNRFLTFTIVVKKTDVVIDNLVHYMPYNIFVQACRELEYANDSDNESCSETVSIMARTESKDDVDVVPAIRISNITFDSAVVIWDKPLDPNGYIESYHITYGNVDDGDRHNQTQCISVTGENFTTRYELKRLKPGNWSIQMSVTSQVGTGKLTKVYYFFVKQPLNVIYYVLGITVPVLLMAVLVFYKFGYKCMRPEDEKMFKSINPDYIPTDYVVDEWEVPREKIKLLKELGQGSFGMVYEGLAKDIKGKSQVQCAIKTVNEHATNRERIEFLNEATKMKEFDTTHVVKLLGVVSQGQPTLVIMELMANGDLKTYLRSHRPDGDGFVQKERKPPNLKMILQMAIEIADGMAYLATNKFVHRDVAARNCMVSDNMIVKIGDFGMTRDIYETDYYRKGTKGLLPVRWMAPESLKDGLFASSSDVWSYGIVLWEMATLASQPYQGLTNEQVLRYTIGGNIMERPEKCPDILYDLMKRCWNYKPSERPTFLRLCDILMDDAREGFEKMSFYHSAAGVEARGQRSCRSLSLDDATIPLRTEENFSDNESDHGVIRI